MKTIEAFELEVLDRDWGSEVIIAETDTYMGKVLEMKAGTMGGLQYHVDKDETFYLHSGEAIVRFDDGEGQLVEEVMSAGESYHIPPGSPHQVQAVTDCVFFEASTPHHDDRVRVEHKYGLPTGGGLPTTR